MLQSEPLRRLEQKGNTRAAEKCHGKVTDSGRNCSREGTEADKSARPKQQRTEMGFCVRPYLWRRCKVLEARAKLVPFAPLFAFRYSNSNSKYFIPSCIGRCGYIHAALHDVDTELLDVLTAKGWSWYTVHLRR